MTGTRTRASRRPRYEAVGDAFATAQLALEALDAAERAGTRTSGGLVAMHHAQPWRGTRR
ncbi:MAG: hypothetical protein IPF73_03540 [Betaproteobacteria bacterium]|nr:hypothetical protein [Betaproteobacteria bacterium]